MVYKCVAAGCSNTSSSSTTLHKFPKNPELRLEWENKFYRPEHSGKQLITPFSVVITSVTIVMRLSRLYLPSLE